MRQNFHENIVNLWVSCCNGNNDRSARVLFVQHPREQGELLTSKPPLCSGFDCIIRPAPEGAGRTTPSQPGHYPLSKHIEATHVKLHNSDAIMSEMAYRITGVLIFNSTVVQAQKTSKFRVSGLCDGSPPVTGGFHSQRASNADNVSIWWRRHCIEIIIIKMAVSCVVTEIPLSDHLYCNKILIN